MKSITSALSAAATAFADLPAYPQAVIRASHAIAHAMQARHWAEVGRQPGAQILYIAGPITGLPNRNAKAFRGAEAELIAAGYAVINPLDLPHMPDAEWADAMRIDIPHLCMCTGVALLPGWDGSAGAQAERGIAELLHMPVAPVGLWVEQARSAQRPAA